MKLQKKSFLLIGVVWIGFIALICVSSRNLLLNSYLKAEQEYVQRDLDRLDKTLKEINYSLLLFTSDWAHWSETYNYMLGKNPQFISTNLTMNVYEDSTINLLTFWDTAGKLVFGTGVDTSSKQYTSLSEPSGEFHMPRTLLLNYPNHPAEIHGYILSGDKIMLAASSTITDGSDNGKVVGTMITGRLMTPEIIKKIDEISQTNLQIYSVNEINQNPTLAENLKLAEANNGHYNKPLDDQTLQAYSVIKDIFGKPIGFFQLHKNRDIYMGGLRAFHTFVVIFAIMSLLFSLLLYAAVRKFILHRIEKLDLQIADIRAHKKLAARVNIGGSDEASSVANEFNALLDTIEDLHTIYSKQNDILQETNLKLHDKIIQYKKGEIPDQQTSDHFMNLTQHDTLTSLPNRVLFNELFNKALTHSRVNNKTLSIIILDIDRFKSINNTYSRALGDAVLKELSSRISAILRPGDLLARLEGDEFIILLNDIAHPKFASSIAEKLLHTTMEVFKIEGQELFITASMGISVFPNAAGSLEDMVKNAEIALYKAKHAGGGVYQYFTEEMSHEKYEQLQLETALRSAITNNEFVLFYQPKLNLRNGQINGVEALVRWKHPVLGLIEPINFLPFAERSGLIIKIGEWVIREACRTNKRWQEEGYTPLPVSVNLSPNQFKLQDISQLVTSILTETGLEPKYLDLEITESAFLDDDKETVSRLNDIHEMGVSVTIDDFGTGRFSLIYIKKLQINTIKIDKSIIKGIPDSQTDEDVASAIIAMAHHLGVKIVAEGVETAEQIQYLFEHQCDMIQGYYISSPLPENKIIFLFSKSKDEISA